MKVHLVDGTYELFRQHYGQAARHGSAAPGAATAGVVASTIALLAGGATHLGVATDSVVESFRNSLWAGYKTGEGLDEEILVQFPLLDEAMAALGVALWPMVEFEADDALGAAAVKAALDQRVTQVRICTPDKDLAQCVQGTRIVQENRLKREIRDEAGVIAKFGVPPASIPDYLALVGDTSDGYPGLQGWGAKSAALVLAKFGHIENIPDDGTTWGVNVRAASLAATLKRDREQALLFRKIATIRLDVPVFETVDELEYQGPTAAFAAIKDRLDSAKSV